MSTQVTEQKRITGTGRIFYGWWIVAVGIVMRTVFGTFNYYGFSAFFNPLIEQFGWSRAALAGVLSLARLEGGVLALPAGILLDKVGPRLMMYVGVTITGTGYILLSRTDSLLYFYLAFIVLVQIGGSVGGGGGGVDVAIANWFRRKRGLALGVSAMGISFGGILVAPLAFFISQYGWRSALLVAGIVTFAIGYPLAALLRHRPEPYGYLPDGERPRADAPQAIQVTDAGKTDGSAGTAGATVAEEGSDHRKNPAEEEVNFSPLQVLRVRAFYAIAFTIAARQLVTGSVAIFLIPFLQEQGMSLTQAATVLSIMALVGAPGRVIFGWLGDIFPKRYVMAGCFIFQATGLALFTYVPGIWGIVFFLVLYAPTYAGVLPLIPAIQGEYFGRQWFATIRGMMTPITLVSGVVGPVFAGTIFDATGSYRLAFTVFAFSIIIALMLILTAKRPQTPV
ncbi:MAG: MFS transporter [Chloroflexi bacterium]|nr:MFS transporter [Chloroflexota bacterium]